MKFRDCRETFVGGVPVVLNRISFSGELGYEIYCRPQYLLRLSEAIEEAGADLGYKWYGARALMSLRLEKGWGAWGLNSAPILMLSKAAWMRSSIGTKSSRQIRDPCRERGRAKA